MNEFEGDFGDNFHIWRTEWDHNSLRIYLDDRLLNEVDLDRTVNPNPGQNWYNVDGYNPYRDPENKFGVWLNLALGGDNGGSLANTEFPAQYLVDYVRVYVPESDDAALRYRIHKARTLLEENQEKFPVEAVAALSAAIEEAESYLGTSDDNVIDPALDALQNAMDNFLKSMPNPCENGGTFRFRHILSGCTLSSGWFDDRECILITDNEAPDYNQDFTFAEAPGVDKSTGMNMLTSDGKYVYRDSWNLYVTDDNSRLTEKNFLFKVESADGYLIIKNLGTGKYFGTDNNVAWSHVYSDKPGYGVRSNYFELIDGSAGVAEVAEEEGAVTGVYNLQGIRIADSLNEVKADGRVYIVVRGNKAEKILK